MKKIIIICICIAIICSCVFTTTKAGFVSHLKCVACKKLGPFAGSRVCKGECEKLNIFPETCAKLCTWMITKHPETSCKLAKLCPSRLTQDEGQFDIGDDEGYYGDNEEEYYDTIHDIATIYSSPTSLHYRFDNNSINGDDATNMKRKLSSLIVRAKKAYTSINRRTNSVHDMTQVRAVAVLWR